MKIIVSDFDHTLYHYGWIKKKDIESIKKWQQSGNLFGIATGRSLEEIIQATKRYSIQYDFYIVLTGNQIYDKDLKLIEAYKIDLVTYQSLIKTIDCEYTIISKGKMYAFFKGIFSKWKYFLYSLYYRKRISKLNHIDSVDSLSIHLFGNKKKAYSIYQYIKNNYPEINPHLNNSHIDISNKGINKKTGIEVIQKYYQVPDKQIIVVGDNQNDICMFQSNYQSYVLNHASKLVKLKANHVVKNIAQIIEKESV